MSISAARQSFDQGLAALAAEQPLRAVDLFLGAMQIEERQQIQRPDMRYLSYYGLGLARARMVTHTAVQACELAVRHDPTSPLLLLNLGRVYIMTGSPTRALACFEHGLTLDPGFQPLAHELKMHDRRSTPTIPFLRRSSAINQWMGQMRRKSA